jgi:lon-related putative ATP-dependent protease
MKKLSASDLYTRCDLGALEFETTDELEQLEEIVGQDRALEAIRFGVDIKQVGYNLYVMGPSGMGKRTTTLQYLKHQAADRAPPDDWCYVNNFEQPQKPTYLRFPAGKGKIFKEDIRELLEDMLTVLPAAFESDEYQLRAEEIEERVREKSEKAINELSDLAESHDIRLVRTPRGFSFQPVRKGKVVAPDEYDKFSQEEKDRVEEIVNVLEEKLEGIIRQQYQWRREAKRELRRLNREVAMSAVELPIRDLLEKYSDNPKTVKYLKSVEQDIIHHTSDFLSTETSSAGEDGASEKIEAFGRYEVNLLVDNSKRKGLPVKYEDSPSIEKLAGRIEHIAQLGTLITDFRLIKAGSLHMANGGYLVLDIIKLLRQPFSWEGLKRALTNQRINIRSVGQMLGLVSTVSLEPEPIPLDVKVVLLGDRLLFYLLLEYDPEFAELFKVTADFENTVDRSDNNQEIFAQMIATIANREKLLPFQRNAVEKIIEYGSRIAGDAEKISSHLLSITDLMRESDHYAREVKRKDVCREDVNSAITAKIRRNDRLRGRIYEEIKRGTILIDTTGEKLAQVNGLSVADLGNFRFGQPTRITATVRLGHGEVIDIEREVELGGAIHSKGVMILSSYLGERYASNQPLALSASLVFEQSYGGVEGDSASVAELCALLSALSGVPIKQELAVTGSVNQHGLVQAIGGVNEKIEGFFDICSQNELTGNQGVIIPESNVKHLMLREDILQAVDEGKFNIYSISTVDQAIELLTGITAGELSEEGEYPDNSVNYRVMHRLDELAQLRQEYGEVEKKSDDH